jgi:hypothetical protein
VAVGLSVVGCAGRPSSQPGGSPIPTTGRQAVLEALEPPELQSQVARKGVLSTILSSINPSSLFLGSGEALKRIDPDDADLEHFELQLSDGTVVGGLLDTWDEPTERPLPLWIASFGLLQDRWGSESAKAFDLYRTQEEMPSHVLVLDHPTSGAFYGNNAMLSVGSYDDARMWIEVAEYFKEEMNVSRVHLIGISMSGQTVVHALIEDKRRGLGLFASGIAISIAPDFQQAPGAQFARLETRHGVENPWTPPDRAGADGSRDAAAGDATFMHRMQSKAIWTFMQERFIPSYQAVRLGGPALTIERLDVPVFLHAGMVARVTFLRENTPEDWNPAFSLDDLEAFMATTRTAAVIGEVTTPLVLLSARDDPAVSHRMFREVADRAADDPWVLAYETPHGGHFGFDVAYGPGYLNGILELMEDPHVVHSWTGPVADIALR